jgi:mono/diheme cytochrome c family protein
VLTDADIHDLYNFFHHEVAPIDVAPQRTALPFPMNIRASMIGWNLLFLSGEGFVADANQSAEWNRGAYLAIGPAHCSTCHTPRGFLMQERSALNLAGGQVGPWFAPNITSDATSGIGSWTQAELVQYLGTGSLPPRARAAGSMGEAVEHSFQHLTPADITAIATYIRTIPAVHDNSDSQSRFGYGAAGSMLASLRGANGIRSNTGTSPTGAELYLANCASCHSPRGEGSKDNYYPAVFHNSATGSVNPDNLIATILFGVDRTTSHGQAFMPGFGGHKADSSQLDNRQIAVLANYVLEQYGRVATPVSESDVATVRQGGPSSSLVLLAQIGIGVAVLVFLLLCLLLILMRTRWRKTA